MTWLRRRLPAALYALTVTWLAFAVSPAAQPPPTPSGDPMHRPLDALLDLYVRDGLVYYRALRSDRGKLDGYVASLDGPAADAVASWPRERQIAFWLNAYNAHVLRAVVDAYPIKGAAKNYPGSSIRQIPGVFERTKRRVAGQSLTLDEIETTIVAGYKDPRLYLALGRGALGSGRLLSEAYSGGDLERQLTTVAREFTTNGDLCRLDRTTNLVTVSPILSWRQDDFIAAYAASAGATFGGRSPVEQAVVAFITPHLLPGEREFIAKNDFRVQFLDFDWRLNDLTGGAPAR
jgi:Protein of unknown function, DUF547